MTLRSVGMLALLSLALGMLVILVANDFKLSSMLPPDRAGYALVAVAALLLFTTLPGLLQKVSRALGNRRAFLREIADGRRQLDIAVSNMTQGLVMFDASHRIVFANRRYCDMYGLSSDVVKPGLHFRELLQYRKSVGSFRGNVDAYYREILECFDKGEASSLVVKTGAGRTVRVVNQPLLTGGWVATHEDITERQELLEAHQRSEQLVREQKLHIDAALNNMAQGLCMFDADGRIVLFNSRYVEMMGLSAESLQGRLLLDVLQERKREGKFEPDPIRFMEDLKASVAAGKTTTKILEDQPGAFRVIDHPMPTGGWVATFEDITDQLRAERDRDRNREFLDLIIENVPSAIFAKRADDRRYVLVNRAGESFWGVPREQMMGKTAIEIFPPDEAAKIEQRDNELLESASPLFDERDIETLHDGTRSIYARRLSLRDPHGESRYILGVVDDVTERKRAEARIAHLAHYDALTGLPNRVLFHEQLEKELTFVRRGGQLAVLYLDLDHFKSVNDTLGHSFGDELLKKVAERLRECVRDGDLIARLGGDEFAIVQTALDSPEAEALAQRLREALVGTHYDLGGHQAVIDLSIGIALAPGDGTELDELLKHADLALHDAKAEGRGTYRYFEPEMNARMKRRRNLELDLRRAIAAGEFELHYQPVTDLQSGAITSCEALLRWRHPERGMISPGEFIPVAEETGLITGIGEWVLRRACADAATWPNGVKVAVNVSPLQFRNPGFALGVVSSLADSGLAAGRLELEITESTLMQNNDATLATLRQLQDLGVRIAMDDFGTGYSSLSHLRIFPFDKIKIDRSFVGDISKGPDGVAIVQAILALAASLKMTTTAEGVETEQQRDILRAIGCKEMQGFLYSPAKPSNEVLALLAADPKGGIRAA